MHTAKYLAPISIDNTDIFNVDDLVHGSGGEDVNGGQAVTLYPMYLEHDADLALTRCRVLDEVPGLQILI